MFKHIICGHTVSDYDLFLANWQQQVWLLGWALSLLDSLADALSLLATSMLDLMLLLVSPHEVSLWVTLSLGLTVGYIIIRPHCGLNYH